MSVKTIQATTRTRFQPIWTSRLHAPGCRAMPRPARRLRAHDICGKPNAQAVRTWRLDSQDLVACVLLNLNLSQSAQTPAADLQGQQRDNMAPWDSSCASILRVRARERQGETLIEVRRGSSLSPCDLRLPWCGHHTAYLCICACTSCPDRCGSNALAYYLDPRLQKWVFAQVHRLLVLSLHSCMHAGTCMYGRRTSTSYTVPVPCTTNSKCASHAPHTYVRL